MKRMTLLRGFHAVAGIDEVGRGAANPWGGACTIGGGPYFKWGYHVVKGVDLVVPVDVYVPGCPPRPEALIEGIIAIQKIIDEQGVPERSRRPLKIAVEPTYRPAPQPQVVLGERLAAGVRERVN